MSFKNFSVSHAIPSLENPKYKKKNIPAVDKPAGEPAREQDDTALVQKT